MKITETQRPHSEIDGIGETVADGAPVKRIKGSVLLAWLLCLFCIIAASAQVVIRLLNQSGPPSLFDLVQIFGWGWALPILFSVLAALIISRQPGNRVGWLLMLPALVMATPPVYLLATPPVTLTPGMWLLLWFDNWSWVLAIFPIFLLPLHFPTGRPPSSKWNWVNWLAISMWLFFMVLIAFDETIGPLDYQWKLPNPIGFISNDTIEGPFLVVWGIGLVIVVAASVISLFVRYRRAQAVERQQIKWLLYVGAFFVVFYAVTYFVSAGNEVGFASGWMDLLLLLSILAFPVAIAIAILRYRLFEIDIIIRKTLVYGVLTALLAGIYFGTVVISQSLIATISGQGSAVAIVISTLAIAALFNPLRRRVQGWIDRRFYRGKYDTAFTLNKFAQTARDEVDLDRLAAELMRVVEGTMQPESAGLWLRRPGKRPIDQRASNSPAIRNRSSVESGL